MKNWRNVCKSPSQGQIMAHVPNDKTSPNPEREEERWVGEGGNSQHYRHTDEPKSSGDAAGHASRPGHPGGAADNDSAGSASEKDRAWRPFDATYGKDYGERFTPAKPAKPAKTTKQTKATKQRATNGSR